MSLGSILVAEPDPMQRQLLDVLFGVDGTDLTMVETGELALAHLRVHTPDAVILATDLPDVPGTTICQKAKSVSRLSRVPVVLVAPEPKAGGSVAETLRRDARLSGADLLVHRPLGDKNLRERVQRLITSPPSDPGLAPLPLGSTAVLQPDQAARATPPDVPQAATELGALRAEVARLRAENDQLKARIARSRDRLEAVRAELDELRKKPRGLFGRRA